MRIFAVVLFAVSLFAGLLVLAGAAYIAQVLIISAVGFGDDILSVLSVLAFLGLILVGWGVSKVFNKAQELWKS